MPEILPAEVKQATDDVRLIISVEIQCDRPDTDNIHFEQNICIPRGLHPVFIKDTAKSIEQQLDINLIKPTLTQIRHIVNERMEHIFAENELEKKQRMQEIKQVTGVQEPGGFIDDDEFEGNEEWETIEYEEEVEEDDSETQEEDES